MTVLNALLAAVSTYSAIPVPQVAWEEKTAKYALCCFPAVGLFCGGALWGWYRLCHAWRFSGALFGAGAVCLPLLLTGGIHMDGYMDTVDALASHQSQARKLEILKDPHCGAFAVLYCGVYLLLQFGLMCQLYQTGLPTAVALGYVLSRALSAFCALITPNARNGGMLFAYTKNAPNRSAAVAMGITAGVASGGMIALSHGSGLWAVGCAWLSMLCCRRMARKQFGGMTGDLSGFFLQVCELAMLLGAMA